MTANVMSPTLKDRYLEQLIADETAISEAGAAYEIAKAALEMGLRRYMALRDFVTEQLGTSPYSPGVAWPNDPDPENDPWSEKPDRGHYRFAGTKIGDAVVQVLKEAYEAFQLDTPDPKHLSWLALDRIVIRLADGGLGFPDPVQARAINAALQAVRKSGAILAGKGPKAVVVYAYNPASDLADDEEDKDEESPI